MNSFHVIISKKSQTVTFESQGAFEELKNISYQIWLSIFFVYLLLTTVEIIEKRIKGIPNKVSVCMSKNLFIYFGSILGKGFHIPSLNAIRISAGVWLLQLVVLLNLFSGILKANQLNQGTTNINSIEDFLRTPNWKAYPFFKEEFCFSSEKNIIRFCKRFSTEKKGEYVYFSNFVYAARVFLATGDKIYKLFHIGSSKYYSKPAAYLIQKTVHPEAVQLINKRLSSFYETNQFIPMYRYVEMLYESEITKPGNEFRKIEMKGIGTIFALWFALLSVTSFEFIIEMIINRDFYDTSIN